MPINVGQVVYSKSGRDKGRVFIVLKTENEFAYLSDGALRPTQKPKKKKEKHIQITNTVLQDIILKIDANNLTDNDVKKALKLFCTASTRVLEPAISDHKEVQICPKTM